MARGGARPGGGRPPGAKNKNKKYAQSINMSIRISPEEKAILTERAAQEGVTVTEYIKQRCLRQTPG